MSKRRNRKNRPNLPEEVLARARREAGIEDEEAVPEEEEPEEVAQPEPSRPSRPAPRSQRRPQGEMPQVQRRTRRSIDPKELSHAEVYEMLVHPTRDVSEAELRAQYGYILADLRSMGALAGLLFVLMIVVARFL